MFQNRPSAVLLGPVDIIFYATRHKFVLSTQVITDTWQFFADEKVSMATFSSNCSSKSDSI